MKTGMMGVFDTRGRMDRYKYMFACAMCGLALIVSPGAVHWDGLPEQTANLIGLLFAVLSYLQSGMLLAIFIVSSIKRLRDMNKPPVHVLFLLIPLYDLLFWAGMLLAPSTSGRENAQGPDFYWQLPLIALIIPVVTGLGATVINRFVA